jgi:hypothetical protein
LLQINNGIAAFAIMSRKPYVWWELHLSDLSKMCCAVLGPVHPTIHTGAGYWGATIVLNLKENKYILPGL